jgi:hypothetical protein
MLPKTLPEMPTSTRIITVKKVTPQELHALLESILCKTDPKQKKIV